MKTPPPQPTRSDIEAALERLRRSLAKAEPGSPAAGAFSAAIERHERMLAEIDGRRE